MSTLKDRKSTVGTNKVYDVAVVGAGVVGAAIARELTNYQLAVALVEASDDIGNGTTKANTAIRHTGFDAKPGSLESALLQRSFPLLAEYATKVGIPLEVPGAVLVAWDEEQLARLGNLSDRAKGNGYDRVRLLEPSEVYAREPNLGPGVLGGLHIPDEGIICPFSTVLALATEAVVNGADLIREAPVERVRSEGELHLLDTPRGTVQAHWVVNAAGLYSDIIDCYFGHENFEVQPRRGQLIVFDKFARRLINGIVLPVPTAITKGVLVAPTVWGNVLLGPTAENVSDRRGTQTTPEGLAYLVDQGSRIMPALIDEEITTTYAGLRAATQHDDYQIHSYPEQHYVAVGGIRSTGVSACMGIAAYVVDLFKEGGLAMIRATNHQEVRLPPLGETMVRRYQDEEAIARNPNYGKVVCFCEKVSLGELVDALASPVPPTTLEALKRRTRAMLGRCQGFYCSTKVCDTFASRGGLDPELVMHLHKETRP